LQRKEIDNKKARRNFRLAHQDRTNSHYYTKRRFSRLCLLDSANSTKFVIADGVRFVGCFLELLLSIIRGLDVFSRNFIID
jgi:hypothetical protein